MDGVATKWRSVTSRIAQSRIFEPLLFAIFISDFLNILLHENKVRSLSG